MAQSLHMETIVNMSGENLIVSFLKNVAENQLHAMMFPSKSMDENHVK